MLLDFILNNKDEIIDIFERYGASNIKIIGSVSRREERGESDIDFVADLKENSDGSHDLQALADLIKELRNYFKRKIDLATHEQINCQYPNALNNGIALSR
jgi:uncharacterized protein